MRRIIGGLAALALAVTLAGCGGGDEEPEASPSSSASASESASAEPSEEPSETVAPIEGVTRTVPGVSVTVPQGWRKIQYIGQIAFYSKRTPQSFQEIALGGLDYYDKPSLEEGIEHSAGLAMFTGKYQRLDNLRGPGRVPMYHLRGKAQEGVTDVVGAVTASHIATVMITSDLPAEEHEAFVESVVPTISYPAG